MKECRPQQVKEEAATLETAINNFASRLDERRENVVLAIECFKASNNVNVIIWSFCKLYHPPPPPPPSPSPPPATSPSPPPSPPLLPLSFLAAERIE